MVLSVKKNIKSKSFNLFLMLLIVFNCLLLIYIKGQTTLLRERNIVIFNKSHTKSNHLLFDDYGVEGAWNIQKADIEKAHALSKKCFDEKSGETPFQFEEYIYQYVGLLGKNNIKYIYVNALLERSIYNGVNLKWKKRLVGMSGGGPAYFHIMLNFENNSCEYMSFNGPA